MFIGWIDRDAHQYEASHGKHCDVAYEILEASGVKCMYSITDDSEEMLLERGWVKTYFTCFACSKTYRIFYNALIPPTKAQKDLILELISEHNAQVNSELKNFLSC